MAGEERGKSSEGASKRLKTVNYELQRKPQQLGIVGPRVFLRANYFKITKLPASSPQLYEVEITPCRPVLDETTKLKKKDEQGNLIWERVKNVVVPPSSATNRKLIKRLVKLHGDEEFGGKVPCYDGYKLLYSQAELRFQSRGETSHEVLLDLPEEKDETGNTVVCEARFFVRLSRPADNDINLDVLRVALEGRTRTVPQNAISALETLLKEGMDAKFTIIGQTFFNPAQPPFDLGGGVDGWRGFHQSIRPTQQGTLAVNVDTAVSAFVRPQSVLDFVAGLLRITLEQLRRRPPLTPEELQKVEKALKGLTVEVTHMGTKRRKIRAQKISRQPVGAIKFEWNKKDGGNNVISSEKVTVPQYFREAYGRELLFPNLPAFMSGRDQQSATPMEVCAIVKGHRVRKLTDLQTSALIKQAAVPPTLRKTQTQQIVLSNNYNQDPLLQQWGLEVSPEMMRVEARVLPAPDLMYKGGQTVRNSPGKWNLTPHGGRPRQMFRSTTIKSWAVLNLASQERSFCINNQKALNIARSLNQEGRNFGLDMADFRPEWLVTGDRWNIGPTIEHLKKLRPHFVLVILPAGKIPLYPELKKACEVQPEEDKAKGKQQTHDSRGLVTQCCSADKVFNAKQQYYANLVQKINTKTGGQNVSFADSILRSQPKLADGKTIFMGADVSHAAGHRAEVPSVAAVVGSFNVPVPTLFQAEVSAQKPRQEIIENLYVASEYDPVACRSGPGGAVRKLLLAFYQMNATKPQRIVFYRDGVSEGQFQQVPEAEVAAIKQACKSLEAGYNPQLTFIVVQKRHHTRFYPENPRDPGESDQKGNIKAGTVVDRDVTHPSLFDFFLCSHEGIQGTNRPVHYYVLYDENGFAADEIQRLTNDLCYTYAACTRSISVAPPAYYADLAATRARLYMEQDWDTESQSSGQSGSEDRWRTYAMPRVQEDLKKRMVFC